MTKTLIVLEILSVVQTIAEGIFHPLEVTGRSQLTVVLVSRNRNITRGYNNIALTYLSPS